MQQDGVEALYKHWTSLKEAAILYPDIVILEMTWSEPQCSCVVVMIRGINSKDEQGNANIIAVRRHDNSTATDSILNIRRPYMTRDAAAIAAAAAAVQW